MELAEFGFLAGARIGAAICVLKLPAQPLVVFALARMLELPPLETQTVAVMASLPVGANVYLMSKEFDTLGAPVALSLVMSTALAAITTPIVLTLTASVR